MKKIVMSALAATLMLGANAQEAVEEVTETSCTCPFSGFYLGAGFGLVDGGVRCETVKAFYANDIGVDTNDHSTEPTFSLALGYGKAFNKGYLGIEAGLDVARNNNFYHAGMLSTNNRQFEVHSRINGIVPSLALKVGYVCPVSKMMTYLKAGVVYTKAKAEYEEYVDIDQPTCKSSGAVSKLSPIVALGFEKSLSDKIRGRFEVEYKFRASKEFTYNDATDHDATVKLQNKDAITLRAMCVYNIKAGM